jgi:glutamate N-acetyltransferase/amino-acid N-acetyltransferase
VGASRERLKEELSHPEVFIKADLNCGAYTATAWGCDLTAEYVSINTEYN